MNKVWPFLVVVGVTMGCVTLLLLRHEPSGAASLGTLGASFLGMLGWRAAQPIPEGGGTLVLSKQAAASAASYVSGRIPEEVLRELSPALRLQQVVEHALEARGLSVPQAVRDEIGRCEDEGRLLRLLQRAAVVLDAGDLFKDDSASTQGYPAGVVKPRPGGGTTGGAALGLVLMLLGCALALSLVATLGAPPMYQALPSTIDP